MLLLLFTAFYGKFGKTVLENPTYRFETGGRGQNKFLGAKILKLSFSTQDDFIAQKTLYFKTALIFVSQISEKLTSYND
jgi:hypothetical protein